MHLFKQFTRKKNQPFGAGIEPSCTYCRFNMGEDTEVRCPYSQDPTTGEACKKYAYDPLKRDPKGTPKLREYTAEDFSL